MIITARWVEFPSKDHICGECNRVISAEGHLYIYGMAERGDRPYGLRLCSWCCDGKSTQWLYDSLGPARYTILKRLWGAVILEKTELSETLKGLYKTYNALRENKCRQGACLPHSHDVCVRSLREDIGNLLPHIDRILRHHAYIP